MMEQPIISIIIPIYNLEKYISKCLDSIVSQMSEEVEIILINDGSIDKSEEICKNYCQKYQQIKYFYQPNAGVSVARNNGLEKASGKYILFVDGDDWILDGTLQNVLKMIKQDHTIDIIAGNFLKEFDGKIEKKELIHIPNLKELSFPDSFIQLVKKQLFNPSLACNFFQKKLFIENNIFLDENVKYTEDMDCTLRLFLHAQKIDLLEKPFYVYRQTRQGAATSSVSVKRVQDTMNFVAKWYHEIEQIEQKELKNCLLGFIQYEYSIVVGMLFLLKKGQRNELYHQVKQYEFLLKNGQGKKGKIVHFFYTIFRFNMTGRLMSFWIKNKNKIKKGRKQDG